MTVYLFILVILVWLRNSTKWTSYFVCFLLLFTVAAFRDFSVGTDTMQYYDRYYSVSEYTEFLDNVFTVRGEYFEGIVYIIGHMLHLDFRGITIVESAIFIGLLFVFFKKRVERPVIGLLIFYLLYYYFSFFNIYRNIMAVAIVLFAYLFLENKNILLNRNVRDKQSKVKETLSIVVFAIIVILGSFVHMSVIVLLLLLPMKYVRMNSTVTFIILLLTLIIGMTTSTSSWLSHMVVMFDSTAQFSGYAKDIGSHFVISPFIEIGFLGAIYYLYKDKMDMDNNIYYKAWIVSLLFLHIFGFASIYGSRVVLSFSVARCVLFADCLRIRNRNGAFVIYLYLFYHFAKSLYAGYDGILPYKFM